MDKAEGGVLWISILFPALPQLEDWLFVEKVESLPLAETQAGLLGRHTLVHSFTLSNSDVWSQVAPAYAKWTCGLCPAPGLQIFYPRSKIIEQPFRAYLSRRKPCFQCKTTGHLCLLMQGSWHAVSWGVSLWLPSCSWLFCVGIFHMQLRAELLPPAVL